VQTLQLNLGAQAVVMLINSGNTFATCLRPTIRSPGFSAQLPNGSRPDEPMYLRATDLLILTLGWDEVQRHLI
jgi:hypothetical protein